MSYQQAISFEIDLKQDGVVEVDGIAIMAFSAGNAAWGFQVLIDGGDPVMDTGYQTAPQPIVSLGGLKHCAGAPKQVLVQVLWAGASSITLYSAMLKAKGYNNTAG